MNTQPMDQFLNRERLSDLAQFAVPESHDLWPRIERAARSSSAAIGATGPSTLSLGLSRAWTAVGLLLIVATFAILGLGLVVLVVSNGHDQVPAAQPDSTVTPTPTETATPTVVVTPQPTQSPVVAATPSGEDLAGSHAQPEEFTPRPEPTLEPTTTPTANPTSTPEPTVTPTLTSTPTPTTTPMSSPSPTPTPLPTATPTATHTPSAIPTPTPTTTPTSSPSPTPTPLPTATPTPTFTVTPTFTPTPEPNYANMSASEYPPEIYYWIRANGSIFKVNDIRDPAPTSGEMEEGMRLVAFDITQMASEDDQQHSLNYFTVRVVGGNVFSANALTSLRPLFREGRLDNGQSIRGWVAFTLPEFALIDRIRFVKNVDSVGVQIASFNPFVGLNVDGRNLQVRMSRFERVTDPVSFTITSSRPECAGDDFGKVLAVRPPYRELMTYETAIPATCTRGNVTFEVTAYINGHERVSATTLYALP